MATKKNENKSALDRELAESRRTTERVLYEILKNLTDKDLTTEEFITNYNYLFRGINLNIPGENPGNYDHVTPRKRGIGSIYLLKMYLDALERKKNGPYNAIITGKFLGKDFPINGIINNNAVELSSEDGNDQAFVSLLDLSCISLSISLDNIKYEVNYKMIGDSIGSFTADVIVVNTIDNTGSHQKEYYNALKFLLDMMEMFK